MWQIDERAMPTEYYIHDGVDLGTFVYYILYNTYGDTKYLLIRWGGVVCSQLPRGVGSLWLLVPTYFRGGNALPVSRGGEGVG